MADVFISFTTRGIKSEWIIQFSKDLSSEYESSYAEDLEIWEMNKNGPGDNFREVINKILEKTLILVVVLDPHYLDSAQSLYEIKKYTEERTKNNERVLLIKVIKKKGELGSELRSLVDSNILASELTKTDSNSIEIEYKQGSEEYSYQIKRIVNEIRKHKVDYENKITSALIKERLKLLSDSPKIYVAFGDSQLENNRIRFITQLNDTLQHSASKIVNRTKVFPDDSTVQNIELDYQSLSHLLCFENAYRTSAIEAMLADAKLAIIPLENDNETEAEELIKRMKFQIDVILSKAANKNLPVFILLNIPDALIETSYVREIFFRPGYTSYDIKVKKKQNIPDFINDDIKFLADLIDPRQDNTPPGNKQVYLIEYNKEELAKPEDDIETEKAQIVEEMSNKDFNVVTNYDIEAGATLEEAFNKHKEWVSESNAILIYKGTREQEESWCKNQQGETYKVLKFLNKKDLKRAVYISSHHKSKPRGTYALFNYKVLLSNPEQFREFLNTIS